MNNNNKNNLKSFDQSFRPHYEQQQFEFEKPNKLSSELSAALLAHTEDPLRILFLAIRTCYSGDAPTTILISEYEKYLKRKPKEPSPYKNDVERLVAQIAQHGHMSTFEHIAFTFSISGVSRSLLAQLTRHRIGWSYSVQSQRYVKAKPTNNLTEFVIPPEINTSKEALTIYEDFHSYAIKTYNDLVELGIKVEDARYVLPNSTNTNLVVSCNLRSFLDFYGKRNSDTHAQWEIAELAERMKDEIIEKCPELKFILAAKSSEES